MAARLERVLGCTACPRSLAVNPKSGIIAYPAGSAIVLLNPQTQGRAHLKSPGKCQITCLAWSPCGQFIATGEFGTDPKVRVWALRKTGEGMKRAAEEPECDLVWHKLGISCVCFSPDSDLLVSIGNNHDKQILVWDWRTRRRLAESRLTCQVNAMAQSGEQGRMLFVTVGVRHVKFWYVERGNSSSNTDGTILLQGRSAILAEQRNNTFIDCCCAPGQRTFALTLSKMLVEFVDKRLVNLYQMGFEVPFSLALGPALLFLSFGNGTIRALDLARMEALLEFGQPHALHSEMANGGGVKLNDGLDHPPKRVPTNDGHPQQQQPRFPDVHSLVFHAPSGVLTALYSDRSLYHWRLHSNGSSLSCTPPTCLSSQIFHVGPIFEVECGDVSVCAGIGSLPMSGGTPNPSATHFFTAGADETVRCWAIEGPSCSSPPDGPFSICRELRQVLFLSPDAETLTERPDKNFGAIIADTFESTIGVRCIRLGPASLGHLACGRKNGNICVFDLQVRDWPKLVEFEAHEAEVLCLDYFGPTAGGELARTKQTHNNSSGHCWNTGNANGSFHLMASGSRDCLVHLYDCNNQYSHLLTLNDHRAPIRWLNFFTSPSSSSSILLASFGADHLVICRHIFPTPSGAFSSTPLAHIECPNGPISSLASTPNGTLLVGSSADGRLLQFDPQTGQQLATFKGPTRSAPTEGEGEAIRMTKLCVDPSGAFVAILCSDRTVHFLDLDNPRGESIHVLALPSDCVTGMAFSRDCRRFMLVSYSGCVFIWRLSSQLQRRMRAKLTAAQTFGISSNSRCASPDLADSLCSGATSDSCPLLVDNQFGSLTSLVDIASTYPVANQTSAQGPNNTEGKTVTAQQERDDEVDSGIGGGTPAAAAAEQPLFPSKRFELKRLPPSSSRTVDQQQAEEEAEVHSNMLSPPPSLMGHGHHPSPQRPFPPPPPPPPYHHQIVQQLPQQPQQYPHHYHHSPQQHSNNSRSMSNLHSTTLNGGQSASGSRRRWNVAMAAPQPAQSANPNTNAGISGVGGNFANLSVPPHAVHTNRPEQFRPAQFPSPMSPPVPSHHYGPIGAANGHRFGISNSVSLNAIRAKLVDHGGTPGEGQHPFFPLDENNRKMAKSVTDLLGEEEMEREDGGGGGGRLAECRQRLAQSIRDIRRISESDLVGLANLPAGTDVEGNESESGTPLGTSSSSWHPAKQSPSKRGVQKKLDRQWPTFGQTELTATPQMEFGAIAASRAQPFHSPSNNHNNSSSSSNPPLSLSHSPFGTSRRMVRPGADRTELMGPHRSSSSLVMAAAPTPTHSHSPRNSYLAQKLAGQHRGANEPINEQQQQQGCRSLSGELGLITAGLADGNTFVSASSKMMALHAQACIREMQQACDKLLGTRQLIHREPAINQEERRQLLAQVNKALATFAQRLGTDEE